MFLILDWINGVVEIRHLTLFGHNCDFFDLADFEQTSTQTKYEDDSHRYHLLALIKAGQQSKGVHSVTLGYVPELPTNVLQCGRLVRAQATVYCVVVNRAFRIGYAVLWCHFSLVLKVLLFIVPQEQKN